ncbi:SPOR domain-containing protein [Alteromonas sp. 14N.309.X.WAT.G.H12]|uniref:SPOR domain-containing protein n=1 Tax=Alteromonas sp. 14N.309.X.WAT.G.H12 TaxID=3120824 RepID=UPI002FD5861A
MAQRDYVSRGRTPQNKKKNSNKRKTPTPPSNNKTVWIRLLVVIIAILVLIYFLFSIKDNVDETADAPMAPLPQLTEEEELPELPQEEWEYIKTLPGYEVEVEVAEQKKSDKLYLLQCGSFRTRSQAEEMKAKIAFQGLEAQVRASTGSNGEWFRVIMGPLQSKRDAERARHSLRKVNITTCMILYWNL